MKYIILILIVLLSGCAGDISNISSVRHFSDPTVANDGYTLFCHGGEYDHQLRVAGSICYNVEANHGTFLLIDVTYRWRQ